MPLSKRILHSLLACRHRHLGRIITIQCQTYQVCLDCGTRIRYSWQTMSSLDDREPLFRSLGQRFIQATREKIMETMLR